ncbi:MAG: nucleotidyltransferase family protein [Conexivisphaera sp.]
MPPGSAIDLALILAGGQGKRLRPYTDSVPKPLLELREGYTILDKQLGDLEAAGVRRVVLLVGYLGELIERRYGSRWNGLEILYSREDQSRPLGTWGALRNAVESLGLSGPALVTNGDIVTDADLRAWPRTDKYLATILAVPMRSPYGILEISGSDVVGFREKPILPHYVNGGIYLVRDLAELLRWGKEVAGDVGSLEDDVFPELARAGLLGARVEPDPEVLWRSVDSVKDLEELRALYRSRMDGPWGRELVDIERRRLRAHEEHEGGRQDPTARRRTQGAPRLNHGRDVGAGQSTMPLQITLYAG